MKEISIVKTGSLHIVETPTLPGRVALRGVHANQHAAAVGLYFIENEER